MEEENNAFYLVRKGGMIGIYKSLSDCQALAGSSVCDPAISVYKGYNLPKDAEDFLRSNGLRNASYSVSVNDVKDGLFGKLGTLVACPYQQPDSFEVDASDEDISPEGWQEAVNLLEIAETVGCSSLPTTSQKTFKPDSSTISVVPPTVSCGRETVGCSSLPTPSQKTFKPDSSTISVLPPTVSFGRERIVSSLLPRVVPNKTFQLDGFMASIKTQTVSLSCDSCTVEFDGASKGNPGLAGAGAILRADDGSAVWRLREGVGIATNNVAEYRSVLLGLKCALKKGFKHIHVQGDSKLVCMQIPGLWKTKNQNMADLCKQAKELKEKFVSFQINHIPREFNSEADAQANQAINLRDGQVEEDCQKM